MMGNEKTSSESPKKSLLDDRLQLQRHRHSHFVRGFAERRVRDLALAEVEGGGRGGHF